MQIEDEEVFREEGVFISKEEGVKVIKMYKIHKLVFDTTGSCCPRERSKGKGAIFH